MYHIRGLAGIASPFGSSPIGPWRTIGLVIYESDASVGQESPSLCTRIPALLARRSPTLLASRFCLLAPKLITELLITDN